MPGNNVINILLKFYYIHEYQLMGLWIECKNGFEKWRLGDSWCVVMLGIAS